MCIACNCDKEYGMHGSKFLTNFESSRREMKKASDSMLVCSKEAFKAEDRKRYDRIYKLMVRSMREWNRIEEIREKE